MTIRSMIQLAQETEDSRLLRPGTYPAVVKIVLVEESDQYNRR
jgi:hypothetical protein